MRDVPDYDDLLAEVDRLRDGIEALTDKYDDGDLVNKYNCCGCAEPWELYGEVLAEFRALLSPTEGSDDA